MAASAGPEVAGHPHAGDVDFVDDALGEGRGRKERDQEEAQERSSGPLRGQIPETQTA